MFTNIINIVTLKMSKKKESLELIKNKLQEHGDTISFACSFGAEDVLMVDLLHESGLPFRLFSIDTGRLPEETLECADALVQKYGVSIEWYFPKHEPVEALEREKGMFSFRQSLELRKECCAVRKIEPLNRAIGELKAWFTGIRAEQSITRYLTKSIEVDEGNGGIEKVNPLVDWLEQEVWDYIKENNVPYNKLHDMGYPSIGCAPCTRAIATGEEARAGRWWWETPENKECGLHIKK